MSTAGQMSTAGINVGDVFKYIGPTSSRFIFNVEYTVIRVTAYNISLKDNTGRAHAWLDKKKFNHYFVAKAPDTEIQAQHEALHKAQAERIWGVFEYPEMRTGSTNTKIRKYEAEPLTNSCKCDMVVIMRSGCACGGQ